MKYYKILNNNEFIGIANSKNFIKYSPIARYFLRSNEQEGEYINLDGQLYRASWMAPITQQENYISVTIIEISYEEYEIYAAAIANNETIIIPPEPDEPSGGEEVNPVDIESIEFIRISKINEMSYICRQTIEAGFDLELHNEIQHFSLTTQDQLNLMGLSAMVQTQSLIPYHADGQEVTFYTKEEINQIIDAANTLKVYHTTYFNALKVYINVLETIEEISAIEYGTPIPEEYKTEVLKVLEE